ncbi:MAG: hypothetical protein CW338_10485 [Clostridiales bacterium]|nr:hypothetical protein [Clostridiales bacterium]
MRSKSVYVFLKFLLAVTLCCCMLAVAIPFVAEAGETGEAYALVSETVNGPEGSFITRPVLTGGDAAVCETVNAAIAEKANLSAYETALLNLSPGSTGIRVNWQSNAVENGKCPEVLSIRVCAEGKQPQGRPGQVNYLMTFDLRDGSEVTFGMLCTDEDGMTGFLEEYVWDEVEPELSDYMENRSLSPVPAERFFLDGCGNIVFYYEKGQFSFLSGACGAFAVSYGEVSEWLNTDEDALPALALNSEKEPLFMTLPGCDLEETLEKYKCPLDSFYYVSGSAYLTEEPLLRGIYLLTNEDEEFVTGVALLRGTLDGAVIGRSTLNELHDGDCWPVNQEESEGLLTVPGCCYEEKRDGLTYLYCFDEDQVLYNISIHARYYPYDHE